MDADRIVDKLRAQEQAAGLATADTTEKRSAPLGISLNNPFNMRPSGDKWQGMVGVDPRNFCIFESPAMGLRAGFINLKNQPALHQLYTIRAIITKYAPRSENDTAAYITAVCRDTGYGPDDWLHLDEAHALKALGKAVIKHEQGQMPYSDAQIDDAVMQALPQWGMV